MPSFLSLSFTSAFDFSVSLYFLSLFIFLSLSVSLFPPFSPFLPSFFLLHILQLQIICDQAVLIALVFFFIYNSCPLKKKALSHPDFQEWSAGQVLLETAVLKSPGFIYDRPLSLYVGFLYPLLHLCTPYLSSCDGKKNPTTLFCSGFIFKTRNFSTWSNFPEYFKSSRM